MDSGQHAAEQKPGIVRSFLNLIIMVVAVIVLALLFKAFLFGAYQIPSGSMEDTIEIGDMVFSQKVSYYFHDPEPGDIVTFEDPNNEERTLIKRCIATEGQVVDLIDGKVSIDGQVQNEPYTDEKPSYELALSEIQFPYTVPEDCIWVMGDNRTNSADSRAFGAIPIDSVTGKASLIYWPIKHFGSL